MTDERPIAVRDYVAGGSGGLMRVSLFAPVRDEESSDWHCLFTIEGADGELIQELPVLGIDAIQALGLAMTVLDAAVEKDAVEPVVEGIPMNILPPQNA